MAPTLTEIETDPEFRALKPDEQEQVRMGFLRTYLLPDPDFKALSPQDKGTIATRVMAVPEPVGTGSALLQSILAGDVVSPVTRTVRDILGRAPKVAQPPITPPSLPPDALRERAGQVKLSESPRAPAVQIAPEEVSAVTPPVPGPEGLATGAREMGGPAAVAPPGLLRKIEKRPRFLPDPEETADEIARQAGAVGPRGIRAATEAAGAVPRGPTVPELYRQSTLRDWQAVADATVRALDEWLAKPFREAGMLPPSREAVLESELPGYRPPTQPGSAEDILKRYGAPASLLALFGMKRFGGPRARPVRVTGEAGQAVDAWATTEGQALLRRLNALQERVLRGATPAEREAALAGLNRTMEEFGIGSLEEVPGARVNVEAVRRPRPAIPERAAVAPEAPRVPKEMPSAPPVAVQPGRPTVAPVVPPQAPAVTPPQPAPTTEAPRGIAQGPGGIPAVSPAPAARDAQQESMRLDYIHEQVDAGKTFAEIADALQDTVSNVSRDYQESLGGGVETEMADVDREVSPAPVAPTLTEGQRVAYTPEGSQSALVGTIAAVHADGTVDIQPTAGERMLDVSAENVRPFRERKGTVGAPGGVERRAGIPEAGLEKLTFKELASKSDALQTQIDARHDALEKSGVSWEDQKKDPQLEKLYDERIKYDTAGAQRGYNGAKAILDQELAGLPSDTLYVSLDSILRERYSLTDKPTLGVYMMSEYTGRALDSKETVRKLAEDISKLIVARDYPQADYFAVMESAASALSSKGKAEIFRQATEKAIAVHDRIRKFFMEGSQPSISPPTEAPPAAAPAAEAQAPPEVVSQGPVEIDKWTVRPNRTWKVVADDGSERSFSYRHDAEWSAKRSGGKVEPVDDWTVGRYIDGAWNGRRFKTRDEAIAQAQTWKDREVAQAVPPKPTEPVRPLLGRRPKTLLSADKISDFQIGRDRVERRGDKTFVVDSSGEHAPVEVKHDAIEQANIDNLKKLNPAQLDRMESETRSTPYLSQEGKQERLDAIASIRKGAAPTTPPTLAALRAERDRLQAENARLRGETLGEIITEIRNIQDGVAAKVKLWRTPRGSSPGATSQFWAESQEVANAYPPRLEDSELNVGMVSRYSTYGTTVELKNPTVFLSKEDALTDAGLSDDEINLLKQQASTEDRDPDYYMDLVNEEYFRSRGYDSIVFLDDEAPGGIAGSVVQLLNPPKEFQVQEKLATATTPEAPTERYEHADRFGKLVNALYADVAAETLPKNPRELRQIAAQNLGLDPARLGQDPVIVDDLYDAIEVALNRYYKEQLAALTASGQPVSLEAKMDLAVEVENILGNRTRTLELSARQQFSTPLPISQAVAYVLDVQPGDIVGEPTAGTGNLLAGLPEGTRIAANEVDPRRAEALRLQGYTVTQADALRTPMGATAVAMNPPWGKYTTGRYGKPIPQTWGIPVDWSERFVTKEIRELPEGGRLVAVMPTTILRDGPFLKWLEETHTLRAVVKNPPGAYTTRGTDVESVLLVADKGKVPDAPEAIREAATDWADLARILQPLGEGGTHARQPVSAAVQPARPAPAAPAERAEAAPAAPRVPAGAPVGEPTGGPTRGPAEATPGYAPPGEPGRQPEAGVPGLPVRPAGPEPGQPAPELVAPGGRERPADLVQGSDSGVQPDPRQSPIRTVKADDRFSFVSQLDFDAASRSDIFAPAPLRSAPGRNPHPRLVVKTRSLAGARLPELTYKPQGSLLNQAYDGKRISDAQWDYGIVPALQANAQGHGFLVAADVGVGKTRMAAGIVSEWFETGQANRVVYITASDVNVQDVKEEFDTFAGGKFPYDILEIKSYKDAKETSGKNVDAIQDLPTQDKTLYIIDRYNLAAFSRSIGKLQPDGYIADEAHLYKNIEGSAVGKSWINLQQEALTRKAKFVYMTATPAVEFDDLAQFVGLREWRGDGFEDYKLRVTGNSPVAQGNISALQEEYGRLFDALQTAWQEAKRPNYQEDLDEFRRAQGKADRSFIRHDERVDLYQDLIARVTNALDQAGKSAVESVGTDAGEVGVTAGGRKGRKSFFRSGDAFTAHVTPGEQEQIMRELAMKGKYDSVDLWRSGVEFEIQANPLTPAQDEEYVRLADFFKDLQVTWSKYRKMNDKARAFTIRGLLQQEAKRRMFDYRLDHAIRGAQEALARGEQAVISTISVNEGDPEKGPIPGAISTMNVRLVESDPDTGVEITNEEIPEAVVERGRLLDAWAEFRVVPNPIERVLNAFGKENVAVIIGKTDAKIRKKMIEEFQAGKRQVAIISSAGKTGISLHHIVKGSGTAQGRRHLIVMDYEWSATMFKQELGRVDRSGQLSPPKVTVLSTGMSGERKFLATIANRMRNLGALSKGSAESASNDKLAEFELGGALDTHAMRMAYRGLDSDTQQMFLSSAFRDPNDPSRNVSGIPSGAELPNFLLDLQFMPPAASTKAFDSFWSHRQEGIRLQEEAQGEEREALRTRTNRGEVMRTTQLRPDLLLHEVKDQSGHRFGILQGLVTDHMNTVARHLPDGPTGRPIRRYVSFQAKDEQISGLEIRPGAIAPIAKAFGQQIGRELKTPESVLEALRAGDRIALQGAAGYALKMRKDGLFRIDGAKMADQKTLMDNGASYSPTGNFFYVKPDNLPRFLERFPVQRGVEGPAGAAPGPEEVSRQQYEEVQRTRQREQEGGFLRFRRAAPTPPPAATGPLGSSDAAIEAALTSSARGGMPGLAEKIGAAWQAFRKATTWEYELRGYPLEQDEIRVFKSARGKAGTDAGRDVVGVVGALKDVNELELFDRIGWLRNFREILARPERYPGGVPEGLTTEQVDQELARLEPMANDRVRRALEAETRLLDAEFSDLVGRELAVPEQKLPHYRPHVVLSFYKEKGWLPGGRRIQQPKRPYLKRAKGSEKAIETDWVKVMFEHRASVRYANAMDDFALTILERHDLGRDALPDDIRQNLRPNQVFTVAGTEYKAFQYKPGRAIFPAQTAPEHAIAQAIANAVGDEALIPVSALRQLGALGRWRKMYIVPRPIAERFENFAPQSAQEMLRLLNEATSRWKGLTIGFWGMAGNVMNLSGDLMNLIRQEPRALLDLPQAAVEVIRWYSGRGSDLARRLEKYDVLSSGYVASEVYFRVRAPELQQFLTSADRLKRFTTNRMLGMAMGGTIGGITAGPVGGLVGAGVGMTVGREFAMRTVPEVREAIPRAAMAIAQLRRVRQGLPLRGRGINIEGLEPERAAMKIAREMTVDYGKFTPDEDRLLRGFLLPFYAWPKQNAPNWLRYMLAAPLGFLAFLGTRMLLELYNNRDKESQTIEQSLPTYKRQGAHIVTDFQDQSGKRIVIYWAGDPLWDALSWVGLANTPGRISDLLTKRLTVTQAGRQQLQAFVREPGGRFVNLLTPLVKVPIELATGKSALTGEEIPRRELRGTTEGVRQAARYAAESALRPLRETRKLREESGKAEGFDWISNRWGLGLPVERVDFAEATDNVRMEKWNEAKAEYIESRLQAFQQSEGFAAMTQRQRAIQMVEQAHKADRAFSELHDFPVSRAKRVGRKMQEYSPPTPGRTVRDIFQRGREPRPQGATP